MLKPNIYVPILKLKKGEQMALKELDKSIKNEIMPLLEIPPRDYDFEKKKFKKTVDEHLQDVGNIIQDVWGNKPVYLDMLWIDKSDRMKNGNHYVEYILDDARKLGLKIIPVVGTDRDTHYQAAVKNAIAIDKLGVCFRIIRNDFDNIDSNINHLLSSLNVTPNEVDLVIDFKSIKPKEKNRILLFLIGLIHTLPYLTEWRNLILTCTVIPKDLSEVEKNSIEVLERSEWQIWNKLVSIKKLDRIPNFGDYTISPPEPFIADPRMIKMSANIRYTSKNKFIFFKGEQLRKGYDQYHLLAQQVINHSEYYGQLYSKGDKYIFDVANKKDGPGNSTNWRYAGTNHHITVVVNELSNLNGFLTTP